MTKQRLNTRERLLEAASRLIWEGSFHAAGVEEICRVADVRKGSFYHFFPSKTELASAALRSTWDSVRSRVFEPTFEAADPGVERLRALTRAVDRVQREEFDSSGVYLGCPFGSLGQEMAHQDEELRAVVVEVFEGHVDFFERALEEAVQLGEVKGGDLRARARAVLALMEGGLLSAKVANDPSRFSESARWVDSIAGAETA